VKVSEVHGMSQRGGSVVTYVKVGEKVFSPVIEKGEADIVLAFEKLEALRWAGYLRKNGRMVVNGQEIDPMPVVAGKAGYPQDIITRLKENINKVTAVDALKTAKECGNIKTLNMVLVGLMAPDTGIAEDIWMDALREVIPQKLLNVNIKAFEAGYILN